MRCRRFGLGFTRLCFGCRFLLGFGLFLRLLASSLRGHGRERERRVVHRLVGCRYLAGIGRCGRPGRRLGCRRSRRRRRCLPGFFCLGRRRKRCLRRCSRCSSCRGCCRSCRRGCLCRSFCFRGLRNGSLSFRRGRRCRFSSRCGRLCRC